MRRLLLKNLCLSSILLLLLGSCAPGLGYRSLGKTQVQPHMVRPVVPPEGSSLLFKTRIKVYNKRYSGLILLKQLNAHTAHLTFVTEIGMKMFDYEITDSTFNLVYVFEPLNQDGLKKLLTADMKLLLLHQLLNKEALLYEKESQRVFKPLTGPRSYYHLEKNSDRVIRAKVKGALFTRETLRYQYNDRSELSHIALRHKGLVRVSITMNRISGSSKTNEHD